MSGKKLDKEKLVNYLLKSSNYDLDEYLNIDHFSRIFVNSPNLPQKIIFVLSFNPVSYTHLTLPTTPYV